MTTIKYRTDIDGLRAIAVLSVVLNHLNASILPGGFVGVDIFFVISGYLITSQVYKEVREGTFSLKQFYKRRINRIVPALVTVVVAVLTIGYMVLSPSDLVQLAKSTVFAMTGLSNIFFWREYGNYFAGNANEAPLLHTWSLGVEEQFYVVWPLLIIILLKLSRRHMVGSFVILTFGAIVISQIAVGIVASASYYLLPTRFFELMIGGLLALIVAHRRPESRNLSQFCFFAGFTLIGYSLLYLNKLSSFPGINALWPCLGAALLIWGGGNVQYAPSRILTSRPMVFIGLISYSLYLWHWPIIAYLNYMNIAVGPYIGLAVLFASTLLAWLSWKYVEVPMRRTGNILTFSPVFMMRFTIPLVAFFSIAIATSYTQGFSKRFDPSVAKLERALEAKPEVIRSGCHVPTALYDTPPNPNKCRLGIEKSELDGILIGDSFANHFTGMVDVMARAEEISLMDFTMDGCPPILGYITGNAQSYAERCLKRNETAYAIVSSKHFRRVVLAGAWPKGPEVGQQLMNSIDAVLRTGAKLTLILNNESIERAASCPIRRMMYESRESCEGLRHGVPEYFTEIRLRYPQVHIVDPNQVICRDEKCSPMLGDTLLYRDNVHLNDIGSRLIGQDLLNLGIVL